MPDSTARKRALSYLVTAALIGLVLVFTRRQWSEFANIRRISLPAIGWLSVLFVATAACNGYSLKLFAAAFGVRLRAGEWFGLECVRAFVNYLPLSAGLAYSAAYLKTKNNLPVTKYVSLSAGSTLLMLLGFGGWGTLLLAAQYAASGELNIILLGVSLAFVAAGLGALLVPLLAAAPNRRLFKWIMRIRDGGALIRGRGLLPVELLARQMLHV